MPSEAGLHILLLTTSYPLKPDAVSGIFVQRLVHALKEYCSIDVLTPADDTLCNEQTNEHLLTFTYAPRRWQILAHSPGGIPAALDRSRAYYLLVPSLLLAMLWATWRHSRNTDIIFAQWSISGVVAGISGRLRGVPVVTTVRGEDVNRANTSFIHRGILALCVRLADCVITVSKPMADQLIRDFPRLRSKIKHVANGVDNSFFGVPYPLTEVHKHRIQVSCIGSLTANKSQISIVRALAKLPNHYSLKLVGSGPEYGRLEQEIQRLGLSDRVVLCGALPPDDIPSLLADTDVVVSASHREGRPNAILEAMAAGRAIVATRIPGHLELIKQDRTGLLFDPGDEVALAAQLQRLSDSETRYRLGQAARLYMKADAANWSEVANEYANIFNELI